MPKIIQTKSKSAQPDDSVIAAVLEVISKETAARRSYGNGLRPPVPSGFSHPSEAKSKREDEDMPPRAASPLPQLNAQECLDEIRKLRRAKVMRLKAVFDAATFYITVALLVLFGVILFPQVCLAIVLAVTFFGVVPYLVFGYETFWHYALRPVHRYAVRNQARAARVQMRLDRFAMHWDAVLDRFPERLVSGLYLPDISSIATSDQETDTSCGGHLNGLAG
ncbi:MAG TPA: hypothetical protein ENH56_17590 [Roseobacter sp.]|uniref:Uncharacterized protein n=1 Tax=marine sediment metagenome TaxID=412755 RepID=A0A0F9RRX5_9ZZZZ|nr:hypothetical protein [Roseobacter sp.]